MDRKGNAWLYTHEGQYEELILEGFPHHASGSISNLPDCHCRRRHDECQARVLVLLGSHDSGRRDHGVRLHQGKAQQGEGTGLASERLHVCPGRP